MNDGVAILLERIKTHPEEFVDGHKWAGLIHAYKEYLNKEDCEALDAGVNALMQQRFTEKVMEELLDPKSEQLSLDLKGDMQRVGQIPALSSITLEQTEHLKAHLKALGADVKVRKPTKFGKLFNYS